MNRRNKQYDVRGIYKPGNKVRTLIVGYDPDGLPKGYIKPDGINCDPVNVRIGKVSPFDGAPPYRDLSLENGAQCGDLVIAEITNVFSGSVFVKVTTKLRCGFKDDSDYKGIFNRGYQTNSTGTPWYVYLTGHSQMDVRDAVSEASPGFKGGFRGARTIVHKTRYKTNEVPRRVQIRPVKWDVVGGKYHVTAFPIKKRDERDLKKEVWIAGCRDPQPPTNPRKGYKWVYERFNGVPEGADNFLLYKGREHMQVLFDGGITPVESNDVNRVVNDFSYGINESSFRMVVSTHEQVKEVEEAIKQSSRGLTAHRLPKEFCE